MSAVISDQSPLPVTLVGVDATHPLPVVVVPPGGGAGSPLTKHFTGYYSGGPGPATLKLGPKTRFNALVLESVWVDGGNTVFIKNPDVPTEEIEQANPVTPYILTLTAPANIVTHFRLDLRAKRLEIALGNKLAGAGCFVSGYFYNEV